MPTPASLKVADIVVDPACFAVTRAGRPVALEPKAVSLLLFLIANRNRVVSKDELIEHLWKDTFVTPNALTRLIAQLRRELGDDAQEPRWIQTVHRRGYRFIAPIATVDLNADSAAIPIPAAPSAGAPGRLGLARYLTAGAVLLVALAAAAIGWRARSPWPASRAAQAQAPLQGTASLGLDTDPALSRDGSHLAWSSDVTGRAEVYTKHLEGGQSERQVTRDGMQNVEPAWSPDGQWIAYRSRLRRGIWIVAASGGVPRRVADFGARPTWSPDGARVAFGADETVMAARSQIWSARRDGTALAPLTVAGTPDGPHRMPQWSPDGRRLAFAAGGPGHGTLWMRELSTGQLHRVREQHAFSGIAFTASGDALLWGEASRVSSGRLWRQAIDATTGRLAGAPSPVMSAQASVASGVAMAGGRVAWVEPRIATNLWSLPLANGRPAGPPQPLTSTTYRNTFPTFSPDGARIAFQVKRPGAEAEVWTMAAAGGQPCPLIPSNPRGFFPHWTPGGDRVFAVERTAGGERFAYLDVRSGRRDAVRAVRREQHPRLSPDGRLVAFHAPVSGALQVFVGPVDSATARQVTFGESDVAYPVWSGDGRFLAVEVRDGEDIHVAVVPATGGPLRVVTRGRGLHWPHSWSPDHSQIAFAGERDVEWNVYSVSVRTGRVRQLTALPAAGGYVRYPAWSPRGTSIVFERAEARGNIWMAALP